MVNKSKKGIMTDVLTTFLSESMICFSSEAKRLTEEMKWNLNLRDYQIEEAFSEGIALGYIKAFNSNEKGFKLKKNRPITLLLNVEKIIESDLLGATSKTKKIEKWYKKNKSYLSMIDKNITYLMHLEYKGYTKLSGTIMKRLEVLNYIIFNEELKTSDKKIFIKIISDLQLTLNKIKDPDLEYGKELFTYGNFFEIATTVNKSFKSSLVNPNVNNTMSKVFIKKDLNEAVRVVKL